MTTLEPTALTHLRARRLLARDALARAGTLEFKPVTSAKWVNIESTSNGGIRVQIEHDTIRGVTPEMMRWWFENLGGTTTWNGVDFTGPEITHYHLWHHRDHIAATRLSPKGADTRTFAPSATSRIQEQFSDYNELIDATVVTTRLDEEEFNFEIKRYGLTVGRIVHHYSPESGGLRFYAETEIGIGLDTRLAAVPNLVRPFLYSRHTAEHWIRHNIEETGRSEHVIPVLYRNATGIS